MMSHLRMVELPFAYCRDGQRLPDPLRLYRTSCEDPKRPWLKTELVSLNLTEMRRPGQVEQLHWSD